MSRLANTPSTHAFLSPPTPHLTTSNSTLQYRTITQTLGAATNRSDPLRHPRRATAAVDFERTRHTTRSRPQQDRLNQITRLDQGTAHSLPVRRTQGEPRGGCGHGEPGAATRRVVRGRWGAAIAPRASNSRSGQRRMRTFTEALLRQVPRALQRRTPEGDGVRLPVVRRQSGTRIDPGAHSLGARVRFLPALAPQHTQSQAG